MTEAQVAKYTPGPWFTEECDHLQEMRISTSTPDPHLKYSTWSGLAVVYGCDEQAELGAAVMRANARLIAAAPELLAALYNMLEDGDATDRKQALAAIQKATQPK